jgi:hypothetical protein
VHGRQSVLRDEAVHQTFEVDIVTVDAKGVRLRVRADDHGGKRTISIDAATFISRFLQHVLPPGFKRIRHYGLLSPAIKSERLAQARQALAMPQSNAQACEDAAAFLKRVTGIEVSCCPHCRLGHWRTVQVLPPERGSRAPDDTACRGPP